MENVKICEIRQGSRSNYPHLISNDEQYLFCCSHQLGDYNFGDKIFCIHKPRNKAFYAELSGEEVYTRYNFLPDEWSFEYNGEEYAARKNDVLQKCRIIDQMIIPPGWKWRKQLGRNQIYPLCNAEISRPRDRLARVNDLQLIFKKGPVYEFLEYCNKHLIKRAEMQPYSVVEDEIPSYGTKVSIYEPDKQVASSAEVQQPGALGFNSKYRKIFMAGKTKPFLLLAGISGIGKSRLVRSLAYLTCAEKVLRNVDRPGNFELIKVKPDWRDSSEVIGYTTQRADGLKYNVTDFIRFIVKAWRYLHVPFFLCLDEMNLAKVEQYLAEFLSIMETRRFYDGHIHSDAFISNEEIQLYSKEDPFFWLKMGLTNDEPLCEQFLLSGITLPPNLIVIGTVNMDETTHSFSRKVLDRAMTIEMNEVNLNDGFGAYDNDWQYPETYICTDLLDKTLYDANTAYHKHPEIGRKVIKELENINNALSDSPFRFAYRVRDEILMYCVYNRELMSSRVSLDKWFNTCFDEMIMMKILSRIEGNEKKCGRVLRSLLDRINTKFPESYQKLKQMQYQLINAGYTSFWN